MVNEEALKAFVFIIFSFPAEGGGASSIFLKLMERQSLSAQHCGKAAREGMILEVGSNFPHGTAARPQEKG